MPEMLQPRDELAVHGVCPDDATRWVREVSGVDEHRSVLPSA